MQTILHMHDFIGVLPGPIRDAVMSRSTLRTVREGEAVYRQGDIPKELYRLISGGVKLCNYSIDGKEVIAGEFRPGDCFGEMGLIDGMPRISHAVATCDCSIAVFTKRDFEKCNRQFPEFSQQLMQMLCRRVRLIYSAHTEVRGLNLHQRLALNIYRLAHSQGMHDEQGKLFVRISQEELGRLMGASRQSINKELQYLVAEGTVEVRYGKIYILDIELLQDRYELLMGSEQFTAIYEN
ncbi:MAG: Crp/Fnr family transcriptional regulator [Parahaliea sp.]